METIPLVSVIIPMFNAARFISQTLESLTYQTMRDFEVVVIDDCSTDNSVEVVESFKGRLRRLNVLKLPKNSGSPGLPCNIGIQFARGKYIAFLDNDDLFTKTALEELTTLAETFQADVINTTEFFAFNDRAATIEELLDVRNHSVVSCRNMGAPPLQEPLVVSDDIAERVQLWLNNDFHWATWATFVRREFLIVNQISFPKMLPGEDQVFNFNCVCSAKRLLRLPNNTYIYRIREDSLSHEGAAPEKYLRKWLSFLNSGFKEFDKVMRLFPFFDEHLDYRYAVLDWFFNRGISDAKHLPDIYSRVHPAALNQLVEKEFHSDDAAFAAYLFHTVNIQRLRIVRLQ